MAGCALVALLAAVALTNVKGTETLITPATCPFTNRSLYDRARSQGLEHSRGPFNGPILESQALKS